MRILHVFDHSIPLHSGYSFRSLAIIRAQRSLGWDTWHLTSSKHYGASETQETVDGLLFHRSFPGSLRRLPVLNQWDVVRTLVPRVRDLVRREKIDLIHAHSPCLNGLAALQVRKELGVPVVYEMRASWEDAAVDHGTTTEASLRYRASRALESRVLRRADQVTCICEGLRGDIVGRGVDPARVTVIPNAVDIGQFGLLTGRDAALESSLGLQDKTVLGFIGSFYAYEGLDLLLAALPALLEQRPNVRLLLVGGGPEETALKAQAQALGIADKTIFTGRVPHDRVPGYSSLVDAFVFPRKSMRLTEFVTPLKPLEAMAQGRVVLASDVGGHRELIVHGETGFLFRHDDVDDIGRCVSRALGDRAALASVVANGRRFVERDRNWRVSVERYRNVYERALGREVSTQPAVQASDALR
ncbi:MAG TPA: glycosyltransferase, exosortase A system-associated [Burkholderiaceae bacterium]|nr:glycosyltransferase, exosortase A system-associated [Burkholderiaceae bacterium]